jgi:hypothetical protein
MCGQYTESKRTADVNANYPAGKREPFVGRESKDSKSPTILSPASYQHGDCGYRERQSRHQVPVTLSQKCCSSKTDANVCSTLVQSKTTIAFRAFNSAVFVIPSETNLAWTHEVSRRGPETLHCGVRQQNSSKKTPSALFGF